MCTVTYIPSAHGFFLTSNRDEKKIRLKAVKPQWHAFASGQLLFPKDGSAGGTWMALHENGNAMVLLNGGFVNHQVAPSYRRSRGLIFLDIFDHPHPITAYEQISLHKIEPFTLVIREQKQLFETRWDGQEKTITELDIQQPHIWSSATLYSPEVVSKRKQWFESFINNDQPKTAEHILNFHRFAGDGDQSNDVLMNRNNELCTVSITLLNRQYQQSSFHYYDLQLNEEHQQLFSHQTQPALINEVD